MVCRVTASAGWNTDRVVERGSGYDNDYPGGAKSLVGGGEPDGRVVRGGLRENGKPNDRGTLPEPSGEWRDDDWLGRRMGEGESGGVCFHVVEG